MSDLSPRSEEDDKMNVDLDSEELLEESFNDQMDIEEEPRENVIAFIGKQTPAPDFMIDKIQYTEYSGEILETLFEDEKIPLKSINYEQVYIRNVLVEIMKRCAKYYGLSSATLHLAVYILDIYMSQYTLSDSEEHQKFVALVTIFLAAKSEDIDDIVPSIKDLVHEVDFSEELGVNLRLPMEKEEKKAAFIQFSGLYCKIEFMLFESVEFNTIRPTPVHFLYVFNTIIVHAEDLNDMTVQDAECQIETASDLQFYAREIVKNLVDLTIFNIEFSAMLPSKVAAAIIATTRQLLGIKNVWNKILEQNLRTTFSEIHIIINLLYAKRSEEEALRFSTEESCDDCKEIGDSGYIESDDSGSEISSTHHCRKKCKVN